MIMKNVILWKKDFDESAWTKLCDTFDVSRHANAIEFGTYKAHALNFDNCGFNNLDWDEDLDWDD